MIKHFFESEARREERRNEPRQVKMGIKAKLIISEMFINLPAEEDKAAESERAEENEMEKQKFI